VLSTEAHGPPARDGCSVCGRLIDGPSVSDPERGVHAACFAQRLAQDSIVALIAALTLVIAPTIVVWAG
jgi:hypothetical protein